MNWNDFKYVQPVPGKKYLVAVQECDPSKPKSECPKRFVTIALYCCTEGWDLNSDEIVCFWAEVPEWPELTMEGKLAS